MPCVILPCPARCSRRARAEYAQLASEAAQLQAKFSENLLDATNAYAYYARLDELSGVPRMS